MNLRLVDNSRHQIFHTCPSQLFVLSEIIDKFACACHAVIIMKMLGELIFFIWSKFKVTSNLAAEQEYRGVWPENIWFPLQSVGGITLSSTYLIVALQGSFDTGYQVLQEMFYPFCCFLQAWATVIGGSSTDTQFGKIRVYRLQPFSVVNVREEMFSKDCFFFTPSRLCNSIEQIPVRSFPPVQ